MKSIVIYFSKTGKTKKMAEIIANNLSENNSEVTLLEVLDAKLSDLADYDFIFLGCPARGNEELEKDVFKPFVTQLVDLNLDKKIALFGTYGWGNGKYMQGFREMFNQTNYRLNDFSLAINNNALETSSSIIKDFVEKVIR